MIFDYYVGYVYEAHIDLGKASYKYIAEVGYNINALKSTKSK